MISGQRADRLSTAVRAVLEQLARFEERALEDVDFFNALAAKVAEAVDAERVGVGILEPEGIRMRGSFGFPLDVAETVVVPVSEDGAGLADRIVFQDVVFVGDLGNDPELEPYSDVIGVLGVRDAMAVGWRAGEQRFGVVVAFDSISADGFDADDVLVLRLASDVSAFIYRQRQVRKREQVLLALTDELSKLPTFEAMAAATCRVAGELLPGIECGIVEVPRATPGVLRTLSAPSGVGTLIDAVSDSSGTGAATVIATGRPLETDDLEGFSKHGATLAKAGYRRVRCLPITAGGALPDGRIALGTIGFLGRSRQPFTDDERTIMDELAKRLGVLAHRAELLAQQAEASAGLQVALEAAIEIGSSLDPPLVIGRLLRRATEALAADRATLSSIDGDDLVIEGSYAVDGTAFEVGRRYHYAMSQQFMTVLRTRQPLRETYRLEEAEESARPALAGMMHTVTVPIVEGEAVIATVTVSRRSDRAFTAADGRLLELVTAAAGIALQHARLFQETARGRASLQVALEAAEDVAAAVSLDDVIDKLLRRACDASGASHAVLGHVDGLAVVVDNSTYGEGVGLRWPVSEDVLETLRAGHPMQIENPAAHAPTPEHAAVVRGGWALTVPLVLESEMVGTIGLTRHGSRFTDDEIDSVRRLAPLAALLVRNARLLEDATQASRAKSDFLNMAGHELRTPLAVVRGYLSLVASGAYGDPPQEWQPVLALLDEKSRDLATMVESILVAARLQSGRLQLGSEEVDIIAVVRQAVDRAGAAAALTGGAVIGRYPVGGIAVRGDRLQLGVIVDNLLANAIKYSPPPAAVTVTVRRHRERVEVRVADRGRGVARAQWERIFEEFVRVEDPSGDFPAGTGLGLYIARQLAERYSGSLELESSELGVGSTFVLRLPVA